MGAPQRTPAASSARASIMWRWSGPPGYSRCADGLPGRMIGWSDPTLTGRVPAAARRELHRQRRHARKDPALPSAGAELRFANGVTLARQVRRQVRRRVRRPFADLCRHRRGAGELVIGRQDAESGPSAMWPRRSSRQRHTELSNRSRGPKVRTIKNRRAPELAQHRLNKAIRSVGCRIYHNVPDRSEIPSMHPGPGKANQCNGRRHHTPPHWSTRPKQATSIQELNTAWHSSSFLGDNSLSQLGGRKTLQTAYLQRLSQASPRRLHAGRASGTRRSLSLA